MGHGGGTLQRTGSHFPVTIFKWDDVHTYVGEEIGHLWFSQVTGPDSYGNFVAIWRGPMDVSLENVKDQTEALGWKDGMRIRGPDLIHVVAEFPQIRNGISLMYAYQAMLADELARSIFELGHPVHVKGTDVYVEGRKLNVGVCAATATSCTMHFGVNMALEGKPPIPEGVKASSLSELLGDEEKALDLMGDIVSRWLSRIDQIHLKEYKTA